ncbi:MAG: c-type cytochrome [Candidatus Thiodiazotropha sp. (ex Notomyrtea botanica)]|nr:c-type cytochrome [Candidatus Thiodiazotropha sp. (ex Notomyrtea botanica)]
MKILTQSLASILLLVILTSNVFAAPSPAFEGRKLYVSHCLICHGIDGKGNGPLARKMEINAEDLTSAVRSRSDNALMKIISGEGRENIADGSGHGQISNDMPKWKEVFSDDQISTLIAYLRFLSTSKHTLTGDPELGMQLYQNYCSICHGKDGDGKGIMINLIGLKPIDHTNPARTDKMSNEDLARSILEGKGRFMPAWRDILNQSEVNGIVSYIRLLYQVWGKLEEGGFVIVLRSPTMDTNEDSTRSLLKDTSCGSAENISKMGKTQAVSIGKQFKSRGVPIDKVLTSPHCLAKETADSAFGQAETAEYLASTNNLPEDQKESNETQLERRIGSFSGKGNLVILTHESNINALTFQTLKKGYFLVLMPIGENEYEEVGIYKLNI